MTASSLPAALRAGAAGLYALEAATGLIIAHGTWLARSNDFGHFIHHGPGTAAIDWEAAIDALHAGGLPCSGLLTELPDVAAAQEGQPSPRLIVGVSERSRLPGHGCHIASLIATETGHTVLNHLTSFSSLPIFDISRGGP